MIIKNFKELAKNSLREKALLIAEAGYEAIDIEKAVNSRIKIENNILKISHGAIPGDSAETLAGSGTYAEFNLDNFERVFLVGIGKGSALASLALAKILNRQLTKGIAMDIQLPRGFTRIGTRIYADKKLEILKGTHPLPSKQNIEATKKIIKLVSGLNEKDLLIIFVCGGGSALFCGSERELKASRIIFKGLTKKGANIIELNTVRKHLSEVKGGGLARIAYPATVVSLIVSDVLGNDISMVASGPTVYDKTTKKDAESVLKKYKMIIGPRQSASKSAIVRVLVETPKDRKYFKKVKDILFISNKDAVSAMTEKAKKLGLKPKIYSLKLKGEAKKSLFSLIKAVPKNGVMLAAGETTVTLQNQESRIKNKGLGKGGRNQESVLGALAQLPITNYQLPKNEVFLSFASDGQDNTEAAGAIGDFLTVQKAKKLKLNPAKFLKNHDSFHFFQKTRDLIFTELKTFNVADLILIMKSNPKFRITSRRRRRFQRASPRAGGSPWAAESTKKSK